MQYGFKGRGWKFFLAAVVWLAPGGAVIAADGGAGGPSLEVDKHRFFAQVSAFRNVAEDYRNRWEIRMQRVSQLGSLVTPRLHPLAAGLLESFPPEKVAQLRLSTNEKKEVIKDLFGTLDIFKRQGDGAVEKPENVTESARYRLVGYCFDAFPFEEYSDGGLQDEVDFIVAQFFALNQVVAWRNYFLIKGMSDSLQAVCRPDGRPLAFSAKDLAQRCSKWLDSKGRKLPKGSHSLPGASGAAEGIDGGRKDAPGDRTTSAIFTGGAGRKKKLVRKKDKAVTKEGFFKSLEEFSNCARAYKRKYSGSTSKSFFTPDLHVLASALLASFPVEKIEALRFSVVEKKSAIAELFKSFEIFKKRSNNDSKDKLGCIKESLRYHVVVYCSKAFRFDEPASGGGVSMCNEVDFIIHQFLSLKQDIARQSLFLVKAMSDCLQEVGQKKAERLDQVLMLCKGWLRSMYNQRLSNSCSASARNYGSRSDKKRAAAVAPLGASGDVEVLEDGFLCDTELFEKLDDAQNLLEFDMGTVRSDLADDAAAGAEELLLASADFDLAGSGGKKARIGGR